MQFEKISAVNEIKELIKLNPDYTLGQILYSFCRIATHKNGTGKLSDLLNISDNEINNAIEQAKHEERTED
jgi:hypothetical protein